MSHQADSNGFRHESKTEAKFFIMLIMLHFCSVFQLEYCTSISQLSVVKLTLTLYFAKCLSFYRLKALNILNFSCLPDTSLLSTLRVPGAWYIGYLGWYRQPGPDCGRRQERSASFSPGTVFIVFLFFFRAFSFLSKMAVSCSVWLRITHRIREWEKFFADFLRPSLNNDK